MGANQGGTALAVGTMVELMTGAWVARAVSVAAELGIADQVVGVGKSIGELARAVGVNEGALSRLMRALVAQGLFREEGKRYFNSEKSEGFRSDVPWSMRASARAQLGQEHYCAWGELLHCVKTGEDGVRKHYGVPVWEYYGRHPEHAAVFNGSMTSLTAGIERGVMEAYDFSGLKHVVDVGGGHGRLLTQILGKAGGAKGTLFDVPSVVEGATVEGRIEKVGGDFFKSVPSGGDLYVMKFIMHDWADREATAILKNVRKVMVAGGKVMLVETVVPEGNGESFAKFLDLNMLVMTGGMERTEAEYGRLFAGAGLRLTRVVATESVCSIVEGEAE